jgi:hypothetical protein
LQPNDRQDGIAAGEAESLIGQAVAEVRIVLPRAGLVHERERDRQCSHCPGLRWHPARVISSHPRSITPAEPTRLGTPGDTKTERSRRTLGLSAVAVLALRAWSGSQADEQLVSVDSWQDTGLLVDTPKGRAGRPSKRLSLNQASALLAAAEGTRMHAYIAS